MKGTTLTNRRAAANRRGFALALSLVLLLACARAAGAQEQPPAPALAPYLDSVRALMSRPRIAAAFDFVDRNREETLREWVAITEVNAPSGKERERALFVEKSLRRHKLDRVYFDKAGNLVAVRKGTGGGPTVVIDAHLDTVFQEGQIGR